MLLRPESGRMSETLSSWHARIYWLAIFIRPSQILFLLLVLFFAEYLPSLQEKTNAPLDKKRLRTSKHFFVFFSWWKAKNLPSLGQETKIKMQLDVEVSPPAIVINLNQYYKLVNIWRKLAYFFLVHDFFSSEFWSSPRRADRQTDRQTESDS